LKIIDLPTKTYSSGNIQDFANQLGSSGIKIMFRLIYVAYLRLYDSGKIQETMSEPEITEELYNKLLEVVIENGDPAIRPVHEKAHRKVSKTPGKAPTIDLCFRDDFHSESYLGFECKKLETANKKRFDDYIVGGVCRYLSGSYSKNCSIGSMISFVINGDLRKIISEITTRVNTVCCLSKMTPTNIIEGCPAQYQSTHRRANTSSFTLFHIFLFFGDE
jgi:hypothetical protein